MRNIKNVVLLRQNGNEGPRGTAQLAYSSGAGAAVLESKNSRGTARDRFLQQSSGKKRALVGAPSRVINIIEIKALNEGPSNWPQHGWLASQPVEKPSRT